MNEDWKSIILGLIIFLLAFFGLVFTPKIVSWDNYFTFQYLNIETLILFLMIFFGIGFYIKNEEFKSFYYFTEIVGIFSMAFISIVLSKNKIVNSFGLESVIWALIFGLLIGNFFKRKMITNSEMFIKVGLILLGAEVLFNNILSAGVMGLFEVTIGLMVVWYTVYWLGLKMGLTRSFSSIIASATSICGVSAAIATAGAIKGDKKEVSHTISLVLLFAIPLIFITPIIGNILHMPQNVFGAWVGGSIDTTGAVVATGSLYGSSAMQIASIVKMSQNVMIAIVAFLLSIYWAIKVDKSTEKISIYDIWNRFPKFVIGFIFASLAVSFILPYFGLATKNMVLSTKSLREWLFVMGFVNIGLSTNIKELITIERGKPLVVFTIATIFDLFISLISAYIFFG